MLRSLLVCQDAIVLVIVIVSDYSGNSHSVWLDFGRWLCNVRGISRKEKVVRPISEVTLDAIEAIANQCPTLEEAEAYVARALETLAGSGFSLGGK